MPLVAAAFAEGRLSYSKVRALTRVVEAHDEDLLLAYALQASAAQVEERCRQMRNANPESVGGALRAWERRSLVLWRNEARGVMTISVEVPIAEGEVIAQALDRAVAAGEAAMGIEFTAVREVVRDSGEPSAEGKGWRAQQADALVAIAKRYLSGGEGDATPAAAAAADHYQVVVHVDDSALRGGAGRSDLPIDSDEAPHVRRKPHHDRRRRRRHAARRRPQTAHGIHDAKSARCGRAIAAARSRAATINTTSTLITFAIGRTAATRASTISRCSARTITRCCTKVASEFDASRTARSVSSARTAV